MNVTMYACVYAYDVEEVEKKSEKGRRAGAGREDLTNRRA